MTGCIDGMKVLRGPDLTGDLSLATEIADYLASKGVPFREAHHVSGRIVKWCEQNDRGLHELTLEQYRSVHSQFDEEIWTWLDPEAAVERRDSRGGTAWKEIVRQSYMLKELLG